MRIREPSRRAVLLTGVLTLVPAVRGGVDREWLQLWEEAQRHRPVVLHSMGRIAPPDEPGTSLVVHGRVFEPDGTTPAINVVVFAYQTDRDGIYFSPERPGHPWRLQGWVRTDEDGRFELRTVRAGPYPDRSEPAHIHLTLESPVHGRQWTRSLLFADDPLVRPNRRAESTAAGRFGHVCEVRRDDAVAHVEVSLRLGSDPDF